MRKLLTHPSLAALSGLVLPVGAFIAGVLVIVLANPTQPARVLNVSLAPDKIAAKAAVLYDPQTHLVLWQKNANAPLPLASITKLMTAQVVLSLEATSTPVEITSEDLKPDGDWGFKPGQVFSLYDLLRFGLTVSSNDAMQAAAASLGTDYVARMNSTAAAMGLSHTSFLNPTGLDVSTDVAGAYGSAYDVARLAAAFYNQHPDLFAQTASPKGSIVADKQDLVAAATAAPLSNVPGFIAGKTGYTDLAGGNLVVVFDAEPGHPMVAAVLGSTEAGRFTDIRTLIDAARAAH